MAGLFNDFYIYWGGVKLLAEGRSPYDVQAINVVLDHEGLHPALGQGYTYPILLAYILMPLSFVPPTPAALVFSAVSLVAFSLAVALLLTPLSNRPAPELALLTVGAASFVPITGSLRVGQVNLLVLLPLALAFRSVARPGLLAVASAVKLYPLAGLLAYLPSGRAGRRQLLAGVSAFILLTLVPNLLAGAGGPGLLAMFGPDGYYTNESINGFIGRLAAAPLHTPPALIPGLPVEPVMLAATAIIGLLTLAMLVKGRSQPWDGCLVLLLTYAVLAAPHNSLWNFAPLLITFAWCWPRARSQPLALIPLITSWTLIQVQQTVYDAGPELELNSAWAGLLGSTALFGGLLLLGVTMALLWRQSAASQ
jgi:Glycosyltransferase family 87